VARPIKLPNGKFRIRPFDENGKRDSFTYDTHAEAAEELKFYEAKVQEIKRGLRRPTPGDHTLSELFDYWLEKRAPSKRVPGDDASIINRHLRPAFGHLDVKRFGIAHVDEFKLRQSHLSPKTLANHLTLLKTILRMAQDDLGWLLVLPRIKKPKLNLFDEDFGYLQTDEEVQRFLLAAAHEGPRAHALFATAVYTGMRAGELAGLQWSNVDFAGESIRVARSFKGPTKSGKPRTVLIASVLLRILIEWRAIHPGGEYVFPSRSGGMLPKSGRMFKDVFKRTLERAGFLRRENGRSHIRFHDLRHTFASHWVMKGGDLYVLQKLLGHQSIQMTQRYAHFDPNMFKKYRDLFGTPEPPATPRPQPVLVEASPSDLSNVVNLAARRQQQSRTKPPGTRGEHGSAP
jgi:integrase